MPKFRNRRKSEEDVGVEMSSLIDCVFLLLIFFLVTTMMKKLEKQIPVVMPSGNASIAGRAEADTRVIGINRSGKYLYAKAGRDKHGNYDFGAIGNLDDYIDKLALYPDANVRIYADSNIEFQKVIDLLDKLQLKGCTNTDVRMIDYGKDVKGEDVDL